ncbi:MAG: hypothetical protein N0A03_07995, partial [Anaerolineae bacterium]|nr:hypothetical protein [Anaerolineae bacterium]
MIDSEDVERTEDRARLLHRAGYLAIPTVAERDITPLAKEMAKERGILVFRDGRVDLGEEVLSRWG